MRYWCEGSAVLTHYYNAGSLLFPEWETLFCKVMQAHKDKVTNTKLLKDINTFIDQETNHANAHSNFNRNLGRPDVEREQKALVDVLAKRAHSTYILGAMVSIEHIASSLGRDFIDRYSEQTSAEHQLFLWHAKEEISHKDVAFRLWEYLGKDQKQLRKIAVVNFKIVNKFILSYVWNSCKQDRLLTKVSTWVDFTRLSYRLFVSLLIPYAFIFKASFDPAKIDDTRYEST